MWHLAVGPAPHMQSARSKPIDSVGLAQADWCNRPDLDRLPNRPAPSKILHDQCKPNLPPLFFSPTLRADFSRHRADFSRQYFPPFVPATTSRPFFPATTSRPFFPPIRFGASINSGNEMYPLPVHLFLLLLSHFP